jgi:acyl carrier protein
MTDKDPAMTTAVPVPATPELLEELRRICAETAEIPIDKVAADADLAADLGVDSLTLDELVIAMLGHYGMSAKAGTIQTTNYPTIGALADLIQRLNDEGHGGRNSRPDD